MQELFATIYFKTIEKKTFKTYIILQQTVVIVIVKKKEKEGKKKAMLVVVKGTVILETVFYRWKRPGK
jgi:hypothetical protein